MAASLDWITGAPEAPAEPWNAPDQEALSLRLDTWQGFVRRMVAGLSTVELPDGPHAGERPLSALRTRASDDPTLALLDAFAMGLDSLCFYQERIANAGFLATATERRDALEHARLAAPRPGVAATAWLALTLDPALGPDPRRLEAGLRVGSVPGPGERPVVFETLDPLDAAAPWSALRPLLTRPQTPTLDAAELVLSGTTTRLSPGDALLLVEDTEGEPGWALRFVAAVSPDEKAGATRVRLTEDVIDGGGRGPGVAAAVGGAAAVATVAVGAAAAAGWVEGGGAAAHAKAAGVVQWIASRIEEVRELLSPADLLRHLLDALPDHLKTRLRGVLFSLGEDKQEREQRSLTSPSLSPPDLATLAALAEELRVALPDVPPEALLARIRDLLARKLAVSAEAGAPRALLVYALRQRASLFGHNAPDWIAMPADVQAAYWEAARRPPIPEDTEIQAAGSASPELPEALGFPGQEWPEFAVVCRDPRALEVDLDQVYPKLAPGDRVVLRAGRRAALYGVDEVSQGACTNYTLTAKTTRLRFDTARGHLLFRQRRRETQVYAQAEALALAPEPDRSELGSALRPVGGDHLTLDRAIPPLEEGRALIFSGHRPVALALEALTLAGDDGLDHPVEAGARLGLLGLPVSTLGGVQRWLVCTAEGLRGAVTAREGALSLAPATAEDPVIAERATLAETRLELDPSGSARTRISLSAPLAALFDRATLLVYANVALASHGERVEEILGGGDPTRTFQRLPLRRGPLTYVPAAVPGGGQSTLELRVDGARWRPVASLYEAGPGDRCYAVEQDHEGRTWVIFGDGERGARPPSGRDNVVGSWRVGLGGEGRVRAGQLTQLLSRPPGVRAVTNPLPAEGGLDPETPAQLRRRAPASARCLDRVVSANDYESFALNFSGIELARLDRLYRDGLRTLFLTLGAPGAEPADEALMARITAAIQASAARPGRLLYGALARVPIEIHATLSVDGPWTEVSAAALAALRARFGPDRRGLAQPLPASDVLTALQGAPGVRGVSLTRLRRLDALPGGEPVPVSLLARPARWDALGRSALPAELLLLASDDAVALTEAKP